VGRGARGVGVGARGVGVGDRVGEGTGCPMAGEGSVPGEPARREPARSAAISAAAASDARARKIMAWGV